MTLLEKQNLFCRLVAVLINEIQRQGYLVTFGETYRPKVTADWYAAKGIGIKASLHCLRLAVDLNMFRDTEIIQDTAGFLPIGEYWEKLSTRDYTCCWGGRFGDANHFSIKHNGIK